jgi:hypothetical protein
MSKYTWEKECVALKDQGNMTYKQLADKFETTPGIIGMILHRNRHPDYDKRKYYINRSIERYKKIMAEREKECARALLHNPEMPEMHLRILEAYRKGYNSRECGQHAGCSYTWANVILRGYGCSTRKRITKKTRDRASKKEAK